MLEKLFLEFVLTKKLLLNYFRLKKIFITFEKSEFSELYLFQFRKIYMFPVLFNVPIIKIPYFQK